MSDANILNTLFAQSVNNYRAEAGAAPLSDKQILSESGNANQGEAEPAGAAAQGGGGSGDPTATPLPKKPQPMPHGLEPRSTGYQSLSQPPNPTTSNSQPQRQNFGMSYWMMEEAKYMMEGLQQAMPDIPNYRPAPSCANCAAASYNLELNLPICQLYNTPIFSSYICDSYSSFSGAAANFSQPKTPPTETEQLTLAQPESAEEEPEVLPKDKELFALALEKAKESPDFTEEDQEVFAVYLYKKAYREKHGDAEAFSMKTMPKKSDEKYGNYKEKRKQKMSMGKKKKTKAC